MTAADLLQGNTQPLQGSATPLQPSVAPLQGAATPTPSVQVPAPYGPAPTAQAAPVPQLTPAAPTQATPDGQLNSIFSPYIGSRPSSVNPSVLEYYNKQTGQGFSTPQDLFNYASSLGAGQINSFDQLHAPVQPQPAAITSYQTPAAPATQPANPQQALAQAAGSAGLSPTDFQNLAQSSSVLTPDQIQQIWQELGISPSSISGVFAPPSQNTSDFFTQAFNQAGLSDLKNQFDQLTQQISQAQTNYNQALGTLNENPFLSETSLTERQGELNQQAQAQISNLQQQQQAIQTQYQNGLQQVQALTSNYATDIQNQQNLKAAQLSYLTQQAEALATAQQSANVQQIYRYLPDYLTAAQKAQQPFGTAQYGYFKYDPTTQTFQQVSGPAPQYQSNPADGSLFNTATGQPAASSSGGLSGAFGSPPPTSGTGANLPQSNNNPGDLTNPATGQFMVYSTPQQGWNALVSDIQAKISGNNAHGLNQNSTLQDFANVYDPASANSTNNPVAYAQNLASQLGVSVTTPIGTLSNRVQDFAVAIANNEGYFAGSTAQGTTGNTLIQQAAQALVDGTAAPSQYSKRGATYQTILNAASQLSLTQKGVPFNAQQAETLFQNKQTIQPIVDLESSLEAHLNLLSQQSKALNRSDVPAENELNFAFQQEAGPSNELVQYQQTLQDAKGELAKVLSGGGTPTDEARAEADSMLNGNLGDTALQAQIQNAITNARQKLQSYESGGLPTQQQSLSVSSSPVDISDINFSIQ